MCRTVHPGYVPPNDPEYEEIMTKITKFTLQHEGELTIDTTLMATSVTLADLTDWSLVKISVKIAKFLSRGRQKSSSSKFFKNLFLYSDDFPFIKAFFGNSVLCHPQ